MNSSSLNSNESLDKRPEHSAHGVSTRLAVPHLDVSTNDSRNRDPFDLPLSELLKPTFSLLKSIEQPTNTFDSFDAVGIREEFTFHTGRKS